MIFLITNTDLCSENLLLLKIREASLAGVDYVMLRENGYSDERYYQLALSILQILTGTQTELIICHRVVVAERLKLKLHNRYLERCENSFSIAVHSHDELLGIFSNQFALYSNVFETECKPGKQPTDWEYLSLHEKTIALGGIDYEKSKLLVGRVSHIALMSEWLKTSLVAKLIRDYKLLGY